jgi:hypothetical protein
LALGLAVACVAGPALAQDDHSQLDLFSKDTVSGLINLRLAHADGEKSWVDEGFGKSRFGRDSAGLADGLIEWRPRLTWSLSAVVDVVGQSDQQHRIDLNQAYVLYKPLGSSGTRFQARLGVFYPPVSLEHDGKGWSTTRTITPSAINSWIGEEVNGAGLEVSAKRTIGGHEVGLTVAGFSKNDTAGTLLSFRGWSLNDVRATLHGEYGLPPLSPFDASVQPGDTYPVRELDDRFGYYVRADWRPPAPVSFNAIYYDNLGDMLAVDADGQWSWYTRFLNVGMDWTPGENTEILAQALRGVTRMGYTAPAGRWIDVAFESAYVLATQTYGRNAATARLDYFKVDDHANPMYADLNENGWSATGAYRRAVSPNLTLFLEALYIDSKRPSRAYAGEVAKRRQTTIQALARFSF